MCAASLGNIASGSVVGRVLGSDGISILGVRLGDREHRGTRRTFANEQGQVVKRMRAQEYRKVLADPLAVQGILNQGLAKQETVLGS